MALVDAVHALITQAFGDANVEHEIDSDGDVVPVAFDAVDVFDERIIFFRGDEEVVVEIRESMD